MLVQTNKIDYKSVSYRIALIQFALSLTIALFLFVIMDIRAAYSALLGGILSTLATIYMGNKFLAASRLRNAYKLLAVIYTTELIKILFITVLFCASLVIFKINGIAFLIAYAGTVLVYALALVCPGLNFEMEMKSRQPG